MSAIDRFTAKYCNSTATSTINYSAINYLLLIIIIIIIIIQLQWLDTQTSWDTKKQHTQHTTDKLHYSVFWMLQHVFSVVRRSLIVDSLSLCMSTFTGSMFRSEWSTNSQRWCITVSTARLLRTWPTAALLSQTLRHGVICVLPVVVNYSSLDTISRRISLAAEVVFVQVTLRRIVTILFLCAC